MSHSSRPERSPSSNSSVPIPSVSLAYTPKIKESELYYYTLKLILLEYINEPRFQKYQVVQHAPPIIRRTPRNFSGDEENSRILQISNGFKITPSKGFVEADVLQKTLGRLENQLTSIAMKKVVINSENLRRSLLKFYNDMFLNPDMSTTLDSMERFEELILHFTKSANGELNKLVVGNIQGELHTEVSYFIDLLIEITKNMPEELAVKLRRYKVSPSPQKRRLKRQSMSVDAGPSSSLSPSSSAHNSCTASLAPTGEVAATSKPTFKLQEITHIGFFQELFKVDESKLQKDIIKVIGKPLGNIYCEELRAAAESIRNSVGALQVKDFSSDKDYNLWANVELSDIAYLTDKFGSEKKTPNLSKQPHLMIPEDARGAFVALLCKIFKHECSTTMNTLNLSKSALFYLQRASKCWRVEFYSTLASLVYTAANLSILQDEELNEQLTESLLNFINSKILRSEDQMNTNNWNDVDQKRWLVNLFHTSDQCLTSIDNLLSALYASTKPKFSPVLSFYYSFIEADPALIFYKQHTKPATAKVAKKLRRAVFRASEEYYISLLAEVPKNKSIEIQHIHNVGDMIIEQIKSIQKRYNKPLLDIVNLPFECATVLIEAFASDAPVMIKRVEKYTLAKNGEGIGPVDALEMYDMLKELRKIYKQVQPKKAFPFNLEKLFTKYLSRLCDGVSSKVLRVIKESVKGEKWECANSEVPYSSSVVDIFKMINESISIFKKLDWGSDFQIAKIITFLLKSFSDGLHFYAGLILRMVEEDLSEDMPELVPQEDDDKENQSSSKNSWMDGVKSALNNSQRIEAPKPYQFKARTCVLLNDLNAVIEKLNDLDGQINLEELSETIKAHESKHERRKSVSNGDSQQLHQLYTIRVIGAENIRGFSSIDGLSNPVLSLVDTSKQREIAKTKVIRKTNNPVWDEEFEVEIPVGQTRTIALTVWHRPSAKLRKLSSYDVCGKCSFFLDAKRYTDDGFPNPLTIDLDTQGKVFLEVSLESEKLDAFFCIGRAYRTVSRALDRAIELIAHKFSTFVNFAFSRSTLKTVCGNNGITQSPKDVVYDAIVPLFDYLNANLSILASELTQVLLFRVMLRAWTSILTASDSLLLPSLSMAKIKKMQSTKSLWGNAMSALGNSTVVGYGRPLTQQELEVIFVWLNALCVDFFHNGGEGPPLSDLKNKNYQTILLIPVYYDQSIPALKKEVERLSPEYTRYLKNKMLGVNSNRTMSIRSRTIARKQTVMANATKKNRKKAEMDVQKDESDPFERSAETFDIVLRTLMAKGELDYVQKQLSGRKKIRKSLTTERQVQSAVRGQKIR